MSSLPTTRVALAAAAVLLLAGCGTETADDSGAESTSASPEASTASSSEGSSAPAASSDESEETLPVYWAMATQQAGPRLVREWTRVSTSDPLLETARLVTSGTPADSAYRTLWPSGGQVSAVSDDGSTITVELADDQWEQRPSNMTPRAAHQALQQMVFSLQGVAQDRKPVVFSVDGQPATVLGIDTSKGISNDSPLQALNLISITEPENGASVSGKQVEVSGLSNSFEANVVCQVLQGGQVVASVPITAEGWMGEKLFPFSGSLPLADAQAGKAMVKCSTDDPTGGTEGNGIFSDDKQITIG